MTDSIASYLESADILLDVDVAGKERLFDAIDRHLAARHALPEGRVAAGLRQRERLGATGLGEGVAIPHARIDALTRILVAYLRLKKPIHYDAPDGKPVRDVLVLLVPRPATEEHLQVLADAAQLFGDSAFRGRLHVCTRAEEVEFLFASRSFGE